MKFCRYEFEKAIRDDITESLVDSWSKSGKLDKSTQQELEERVEKEFQTLSTFDLVCALGYFLTKD